jgi:hypothetical protein
MEIQKVKDLNLYFKRHKYCFVYIYDSWCSSITLDLETFFKSKYDLNKLFLKICVSNSQLIQTLGITVYPIILIYNKDKIISELPCNTLNVIVNLEKIYNFLN